MFDLKAVQSALKHFGIDAWLMYDFHGANPLARRILGCDDKKLQTRRWFYLVPADGEPQKLVHRIEPGSLDHVPGSKRVYLPWQELESELKTMISGLKNVAMEHSPRNAIPYVSKVDGGTIELIKSFVPDVVSSGDLIQQFEATLDDDQWRLHQEAEAHVLAAYDLAVERIVSAIGTGNPSKETDIQTVILDYFEQHNCFTDHGPIVAKGPHSGDPHYAPTPFTDVALEKGDFVLIDLWCKLKEPKSVYADYTRVLYIGDKVPSKYNDIFEIVADARDAAVDCVRDAFANARQLQGWQVDDAARDAITKAGYGEYFVHRTGHNIAQDLHGNGTHMDNLETRDERLVLPRTCFSIEPGIYLDDFGVRSEVNVFVDATGDVHVTGRAQTEIQAIL